MNKYETRPVCLQTLMLCFIDKYIVLLCYICFKHISKMLCSYKATFCLCYFYHSCFISSITHSLLSCRNDQTRKKDWFSAMIWGCSEIRRKWGGVLTCCSSPVRHTRAERHHKHLNEKYWSFSCTFFLIKQLTGVTAWMLFHLVGIR